MGSKHEYLYEFLPRPVVEFFNKWKISRQCTGKYTAGNIFHVKCLKELEIRYCVYMIKCLAPSCRFYYIGSTTRNLRKRYHCKEVKMEVNKDHQHEYDLFIEVVWTCEKM